MMTEIVPLMLTLNAGSSSLKFAAFAASAGWPELFRGQIEGFGRSQDQPISIRIVRSGVREQMALPSGTRIANASEAFDQLWPILDEQIKGRPLQAVVHRVVHGGLDFAGAVRVTPDCLSRLDSYAPLAPLHQPHNLALIRRVSERLGEGLQIACFDTAFHRGRTFETEAYALPRALYDQGIRRYGFHGLSYGAVTDRLRRARPDLAGGRLVIAHLGAGCSLAAISEGRSVATTLGFSALEGLPMATRCGRLDPGVLLHLIGERGMSVEAVTQLLYKDSGLKGLSGLSGDVRDLEASDRPEARQTLDYFIHQVAMGVAEMAGELGGLHALVFTAGIGEHSARVRLGVMQKLAWLGVVPDLAQNADPQADVVTDISATTSAVKVLIVPTDEERRMATEAAALMAQSPAAA
ncbi:MAG: acetate/propionate family kinase [Asticcacaulis sp.]